MRLVQRAGFTLIELLIVVVVIGILATIAIPTFSRMREKSYVAAVTSDLKNLASAQEIYLSNQHAGLAGAQCGIYYGSGSASNASPATTPGTVVCN